MTDATLIEQYVFLARQLLGSLDLEIVEASASRDAGFDFIATTRGGSKCVVQVKLYRSLQISPGVLANALVALHIARQAESAAFSVLFTNAKLDPAQRAMCDAQGVTSFDYDVVGTAISSYPELARSLNQIYQQTFLHRSEPIPPVQTSPVPLVGGNVETAGSPSAAAATSATAEQATEALARRGAELCKRMREVPESGPGAAAFEDIGIECLKYLFGEDLIGWSAQKESDGKLHRYDVIARVSSKDEFWMSLVSDHRARYIIFEFKNYTAKITQREIYTTEKYLLPVAMRSMAIIIARNGADENAYRVMAGALREAGKVILCISLSQLCEMLHLKDRGEEASRVLSDTLDEMLTRIER